LQGTLPANASAYKEKGIRGIKGSRTNSSPPTSTIFKASFNDIQNKNS